MIIPFTNNRRYHFNDNTYTSTYVKSFDDVMTQYIECFKFIDNVNVVVWLTATFVLPSSLASKGI